MSDALDIEIAATVAVIAGLQRDLEVVRVRLEALQFAANARPINTSISAGVRTTPQRGNGRKAGAISMSWRDTLSYIAVFGSLPLKHIAEYALKNGVTGSERSVKQRLKEYEAQGFITLSGGEYATTEHAIERFDLFQKNEPPSGVSPGGPPIDVDPALVKPPSSFTPHPQPGE